MPRTARGWIGAYQPLDFKIAHLKNQVLFALRSPTGARIAFELSTLSAGLVALMGRDEDTRMSSNFTAFPDAEIEVVGKLFVAEETAEISCDPQLERWEGAMRPIRMQFEPQPQSIIWSVRDPDARTGFVLKLPERARFALFKALLPIDVLNCSGAGRIEGTLEVCP